MYVCMHVCIRAPPHQGFIFIIVDCRFPSRRRWSAVHLRLTALHRGRPPLRSSPSSPPLLPRSTCPLSDHPSMSAHSHSHVDLALALVPARCYMAERAPWVRIIESPHVRPTRWLERFPASHLSACHSAWLRSTPLLVG